MNSRSSSRFRLKRKDFSAWKYLGHPDRLPHATGESAKSQTEQHSREVTLRNSSGSPGSHPAAAAGTPGSLYWAPASSPSGQCYTHTCKQKGQNPQHFMLSHLCRLWFFTEIEQKFDFHFPDFCLLWGFFLFVFPNIQAVKSPCIAPGPA